MTRLRRHLSFANITAVLALVISLSGTAYAATLITTKQIKNGTIRNIDIHNGTIHSNKIADGTIQTADLAPSALVQEVSSRNTGSPSIGTNLYVTLATITLPSAGDYVVFGKTNLHNTDTIDHLTFCLLRLNGAGAVDNANVDVYSEQMASFQVQATFAALDVITLECQSGTGTNESAEDSQLTAVRIP